MRLFLVRHGETVDNVAGIYAGTRDSPLTAHGVLQARRLGAHLAALAGGIGPVRHLFSSDLCRAVETAQAIIDAQAAAAALAAPLPAGKDEAPSDRGGRGDGVHADGMQPPLKLVQLPELRERSFGSAEGKNYGAAVTDAESREQMRGRAERFVKDHLMPLFEQQYAGAGGCIVVVAHGLILDSLLRVLLARFGPAELARLGEKRTAVWSNTGYVEALVEFGPTSMADDGVGASSSSTAVAVASGDRTPQRRITLSIVGVNVLKHLEGLKKTRGGIGSAQFDKRQRTMDSFFAPAAKKAKRE
ncbi:hypothetical protein VTI74DRAFT_5845 [Chaetomium olivicolor]